jgi:hypothetical protein
MKPGCGRSLRGGGRVDFGEVEHIGEGETGRSQQKGHGPRPAFPGSESLSAVRWSRVDFGEDATARAGDSGELCVDFGEPRRSENQRLSGVIPWTLVSYY